jgi:hypothetical protein
MDGCWAKTISACSDKLSREHLLSRAIFPKGLTVRGLPWCAEPRAVGANALVARCLCKRHNSELSPLDKAARDLWDKLGELGRVAEERRRRPNVKWSRHIIRANGRPVERWCLKVMCNVLASGSIPSVVEWEPPPDLVRRIFGTEPFPDRSGLAVLARVGEHLSNEEHIGFGGVPTDGKTKPFGCVVDFRSFRFAVTWERPVVECIRPEELGGTQGIPLFHFTSSLVEDANVEFRLDW